MPGLRDLQWPSCCFAAEHVIRSGIDERHRVLPEQGDLLTAFCRIQQKTQSDLALMRETGFCQGMENYSRHLAGRSAGDPPETLVHYFKKSFGEQGWLLVADESHVTLPQLGAMWGADRARKVNLINHGFR